MNLVLASIRIILEEENMVKQNTTDLADLQGVVDMSKEDTLSIYQALTAHQRRTKVEVPP